MAGGTPLFAFDFSSEQALAGDPAALLDRLALLLTNGRMRAETRARILSALTALPAADSDGRVRLAVWLVAVCPEAAVI